MSSYIKFSFMSSIGWGISSSPRWGMSVYLIIDYFARREDQANQ